MEQELGQYAVSRNGKIYQKAFLHFPEREVGEINEEERTLAFYENAFTPFHQEVEELLAKVASQDNKGSFLSYLENLRERIFTLEAIGNVEDLYTRIHQQEVDIHNQVRANRERNLAVKQGFIDELRALNNVSDTSLSIDRVKDIRGKWIRVGAVNKEEQERLQQQFDELINAFFERHQATEEEDVKLYRELIDESRELITSPHAQARKRIVDIQKEWKLLPKISKSQYVPLFNELRQLHDTFFQQLPAQAAGAKGGKASDTFQKNANRKQQLIAEMQTLLDKVGESSIGDLKKLQQAWKESGPVSKKDSELLWDQFSALGDAFFIRKTVELQVPQKKGDGLKEVLKARMKWLRDAIGHDKKELKTVEENMGAFRFNLSSGKMKNLFHHHDKGLERRLSLKEELLTEIQQQLTDLEKAAK